MKNKILTPVSNCFDSILLMRSDKLWARQKRAKKKTKILFDNQAMAFSHMQFLGTMADLLVDAGQEVVSCVF
uniref:Uncharacterized protein n=1 Tax=Ditylenchus dipsaci TaxID=166011 RepID=A0A915DRX8_9BILA